MDNMTGYLGIFLLCALAGIGIPMPEDVAVGLVGVQVGTGAVDWWPTLCVVYVAVLLRDLIVYGLGRWIGDWLLHRPRVERIIGAQRLQRARDLVLKRRGFAVLAGRAMVGMRIPVFFIAGTMGIRLRSFLLWDMLGLLVTVPLLVGLGCVLGAPAIDVLRQVIQVVGWVPLVLLVLVAVGLWWKFRSVRSNNASATVAISEEAARGK